jgi:hypothetical protein
MLRIGRTTEKRFLRIREGVAYCDGCLAREMELPPSLIHSRTKTPFGEPTAYQPQLGTCVAVRKSGNAPPGLRQAKQ